MGKLRVGCALAMALATAAQAAAGQPTTPPASAPRKAQPLNMQRERLGSDAFGELARARMKNGDCAGAIEALDAAIRASNDPTLRRDRGACHEQLGHPYPAIDDYRAYLTVKPDAPDAEGIRERLASLEQSTLGYSSASTDVPGDVDAAGGPASGSDESARAGAPRALRAVAGAGAASTFDDDDPRDGKLRRGRGVSLSPVFSEHKWGSSPALVALAPGATASFGDSGTWAECVGLQVRYAFGPSASVFAEAGFEHFNSTAVDVAVVSGLTSQIGYELRFPLAPTYDDQLVAAAGLGFEHLVVQPNTAQFSSVSLGAFVPRVRVGWRHLLAASAGFELSLDAGGANFFRYANFPFDSNDGTTYLVAVNAALVWGL